MQRPNSHALSISPFINIAVRVYYCYVPFLCFQDSLSRTQVAKYKKKPRRHAIEQNVSNCYTASLNLSIVWGIPLRN